MAEVGYTNATTAQVGPTVEIIRTIAAPASWQGVANATGAAATVERGQHRTALPDVGNTNAVGYAATVERVENTTGRADATTAQVGPTVEITRRIYAPDPFHGTINAPGYEPTVSTQSGSITTAAPDNGEISAFGYAPTLELVHEEQPQLGEANAVGYAPTLGITYNVPGLKGDANAVGYAPSVIATTARTATPDVGNIEAVGYAASVQQGQYLSLLGNVNATTAQVGATIEIVRRVEAESPFHATANAVGYAGAIDYSIGNNITVTGDKGDANAVGYEPTVDYGNDLIRSPLVGEANAVGYAPNVESGGLYVLPQVGFARAIDSGAGPDLELIKEISGPDTGTANAVGYAPDTSYETPAITLVNASVGVVNAEGSAGSVTWAKDVVASAGTANATGEAPIDTRQAQKGEANAEGYAPTVGIERAARPQFGVVQTDGSIAVVEIQRGEYDRFGERGDVHAEGSAATVEILGRPVVSTRDDGAGSGGRNFDEDDARIRAEDELILQVVTEWIKRRVA